MKKNQTLMGIDEAGRGPVMGPMVVAAVEVPEALMPWLEEQPIKDSKKLSAKKREILAGILLRTEGIVADWVIATPFEIDKAVWNPKQKLNGLELEMMARLINELQPNTVIIDCPDPNPEGFLTKISRFTPPGIHLVIEHKADVNYKVVGAASIIAKVIRDNAIQEIQRANAGLHLPCGSGYPSDTKTRLFVAAYGKSHPFLFRQSWATFKNLA